jgi:hypothetical protein
MAKTIRVSDEAHRALKVSAAQAGCSVGSLVEEFAAGLAPLQMSVHTGLALPTVTARTWTGPLSKSAQVKR